MIQESEAESLKCCETDGKTVAGYNTFLLPAYSGDLA